MSARVSRTCLLAVAVWIAAALLAVTSLVIWLAAHERSRAPAQANHGHLGALGDVFEPAAVEDVISSARENPVPFHLRVERRDDEAVYEADFDLDVPPAPLPSSPGTPPSEPWIHYICTVKVSHAGRLLKASDYRRAKRKFAASPRMLPQIGRRAVAGFAYGPESGGDWVVFTTNDGRYDVRVTQGNKLKPGITSPDVDCEEVARALPDLYDESRER